MTKRLNDIEPNEWDEMTQAERSVWVWPAGSEGAPIGTPVSKKLPTDPARRKRIPIYTGFIDYFPLAIAAVAELSLEGGIQHGQTADTLFWDRTKSGDEKDALMRHVLDKDWTQVAWRAMANLEKHLEEYK